MDDLGNRTTVKLGSGTDQVYTSATPNLANRYTAVGGQSLAYDAAGNLTQDHDGYHYVYDYENRVTRIYKMDGQSEVDVAQYVYDALGRRIGKWDAMAQQATYYFYNDQWEVLCEHNGTIYGNRYVYGNYIDEPLLVNDCTDDYYYIHDHLYSTAALIGWVDEAWTVVERYEYDAYGKAHVTDASYTPRIASTYANSYTFTGRQLDVLDGGDLIRMHYRYRDYSPQLGKFVQSDPLGTTPSESIFSKISHLRQYMDGLNLYQYVRSDPVGRFDAYGQALWYCWSDTAFGIPIIHHGYMYDDRPGQWGGNGGQSCGTDGSSGSGILPGNGDTTRNPLDFPDGEEPGPPANYGHDIWEEDGRHCTRIQDSDDDDKADCAMIHCYEHANDGLWLPIINDCHNTVEDALDECGLSMVDDCGQPIPPVRMF